jgi:hypothetical protein
VFLHWARHPGRSFTTLDPAGVAGLGELARRARERRIWVTTTGRLLAYAEARRALRYRVEEEEAVTRIRLDADPLPDGRDLDPEDLAGVAFRVSDPKRVEITWRDERLAATPCLEEPGVVWIPWTPLAFPDPPAGGS